ncbi:hypothetical protein CR969_03115 [Candidatus Saccharibacteria bacterium]|nr:MAG: hypothetical protein CR969_03115 [Candidatus Saccharibacteria bacterium]
MRISKFTKITIIVALAFATVILIFISISLNRPDTDSPGNSDPNTVYIMADHKIYRNISELRGEADTVILGSVLDNGSTKQSSSSGKSGDGRSAPELVSTEFSVRVDKSLKGDLRSGQAITVVLTGGTVSGTKYISKGMPWLAKDESVIIYLSRGDDGKYYPLAGGAAIASPTQNSLYCQEGCLVGAN